MLSVRPRWAASRYRAGNTDTRRVAQELNVRYVVEGSVRRIGGRVRISVQLVDAESGEQVWADRFDRAQTEIFAVQDEVVRKIVGTLVGRVQTIDAERARRKPPASLAAYECVQRGNALPWDDPQAAAEWRDVADERLLQVGVVADAQPCRLSQPGERARREVDPETRVAHFAHRLLHHELGEIGAEGVRPIVEVAETVGLILRLVQVVDVPERREGVGLDVTEEVRRRGGRGRRGLGGRVALGGSGLRCIAHGSDHLRGRDLCPSRESEQQAERCEAVSFQGSS
jgi:hypothetical protein